MIGYHTNPVFFSFINSVGVNTFFSADCFLMGISDEDYFNFDNLPKRKIMEHLYRVQRISTKFYEFRQVYDADIYDTSFPN